MDKGGLNCMSGEFALVSRAEVISSNSPRKCGHEADPFVDAIFIQVDIFNSTSLAELCPLMERPRLLLECSGGDALLLVGSSFNESIQQIISGGRFRDMLKLSPVCEGNREVRDFVSMSSEMWWSRESESATKLFLPGICCEYKDDSNSISRRAIFREMHSWMSWS